MNVARLGNKYLADEEPWKVIKDNPERVQTQMYVVANCGALSSLCEPFLPFTELSRILKIESPLNWNTIAQNLI
jgi:methionyl-tRNA synthetase